jgi:heme-degrading monooxygenase HmoA
MKGRVVFHIHLKPGCESDFIKAYEGVRRLVAEGVKGHIVDQVCQSIHDPLDWLITSEWESIDDFVAWERNPEHTALVAPMRACWDEAKSHKYTVRLETAH